MKFYLPVAVLLLLGTACSKTTVQPEPLSAQLQQNGEMFDFFLGRRKPKPQPAYQPTKITYTRDGGMRASVVFGHDGAPQLSLVDATGEESLLEFHPAASAGSVVRLTDVDNQVLYEREVEAGTETMSLAELPVTDSPSYVLTVIDGGTDKTASLTGGLAD